MELPLADSATGLAALADEELAHLIQKHGRRHAAADALLNRYDAWLRRVVTSQVRHSGLARDLEGACQEARLALLRAAQTYDRGRGGGRPCCFCTFLWRALRARTSDFLRGRRRA
jgi:DNA-directed RNA polymerase specialized sigma24 family protein